MEYVTKQKLRKMEAWHTTTSQGLYKKIHGNVKHGTNECALKYTDSRYTLQLYTCPVYRY